MHSRPVADNIMQASSPCTAELQVAAKRLLPKQSDGLILGGDEGEVLLVWGLLI